MFYRLRKRLLSCLVSASFAIAFTGFYCSAVAAAPSSGEDSGPIRISDGMAQPVLNVSDPYDEDYTNEGNDIQRFVVYVETDHDTDLDNKADLVKVVVQVPRQAVEGD